MVVVSAAPAPTTGWKIYGSARRWLCESLDILRKHYTSTQEEVLAQLKGMDLEEGERALEVGVRWAHRNLKNIQESSVRMAVGDIRRLWVCEG